MKSAESNERLYLLGTPARSQHDFQYGEALMHLVKSYIGTGIFSMGDAMKNSGLLFGPITVFFIGMLCLHCCHLLVNCANKLHKHHKLNRVPDYADTAKLSFSLAAPNFPAWAFIAKLSVNLFLIMAQLGFCCCYLVFISWNIYEILKVFKISLEIHWIIVIVVIPVWLTCFIRTLKYLAILSVIANFALLAGILIVLYYAFNKPSSQCPVGLMVPGLSKFLIFLGQSIFAFEGIGLVLILYNEMSEPDHFKDTYGVLNIGLHIVTMAYMVFGTITYMQFGDDIKETVTLNLDANEHLAQAILVLISIGVSFSFSLQLYVAVDIIWPKITSWLGPFNYPVLAELWFRTALVITIFVMAEAIPRLQILLSFIGSFMSVALIVIFPAVIDIATGYSFQQLTKFIWIKDTLIIVFGIAVTIAGTYESLTLLANEL